MKVTKLSGFIYKKWG